MDLHNQIGLILGLDIEYTGVIIGAGNIGQAIANYSRFNKSGLKIEGIFDANPKIVGIRIRDIEIQDIDNLENYLKNNATDIGIICVPSSNAQTVANILVNNGAKGIWNFAPVDLSAPDDVMVENVHLSESLLTLIYLLHDKEKESEI